MTPDSAFVWDVTPPGSFTAGAEGPATGPDGSVYAVNMSRQGTIGRVTPTGRAEVFVTLPEGSVGNGIRCSPSGDCLYVADYTGHAVWRVDLGTRAVSRHAADERLHQPNDLAITSTGVLYASDPDWANGRGRVWRVGPDGRFVLLADDMGTTNGIEVAPDDRTLYVNESLQRRIWAFELTPEGDVRDKRLVIEFPDFGLDGMRFGPDGMLHVARYGKGVIAHLTPKGRLLGEVRVRGTACTNLTFTLEGVCVVTSADRGNLQGITVVHSRRRDTA
jgi:sugar lactone lactonase YvrE